MKSLKVALLGLITILLLMACGEQPSEAEALDLDNVISLGYQGALKKEVYACPDTAVGVDIDRGCILRSANDYFALGNDTDYELTDVVFTSSNPAFAVSPAKIASIGVAGNSTVIAPMLRIAISHGTELNDMSIPDPLENGTAKTTLTITGKVNGQTFSQTYVIGGFAKVINVIRKNEKLYLEGPLYKVGVLRESLELSQNSNECYESTELACYTESVYADTLVGYSVSLSKIEPLAPLSKAFDKDMASIVRKEFVIDK